MTSHVPPRDQGCNIHWPAGCWPEANQLYFGCMPFLLFFFFFGEQVQKKFLTAKSIIKQCTHINLFSFAPAQDELAQPAHFMVLEITSRDHGSELSTVHTSQSPPNPQEYTRAVAQNTDVFEKHAHTRAYSPFGRWPGQSKWAFWHSANQYVVYPGNTPANHPPTEVCTIHSKQHRGCRVQDPGTRGYRGWKTADFWHSARCAP